MSLGCQGKSRKNKVRLNCSNIRRCQILPADLEAINRENLICVVVVEAPRKRLKPSIMIPYQRDPKFVGRKDILRDIEQRFSVQNTHHRLALVGLGGVG